MRYSYLSCFGRFPRLSILLWLILRRSQQRLDSMQEVCCNANSLDGLGLRHMNGSPVVTYTTKFKQQVQCFALLLIHLTGFDQVLVDGCNDPAVLAERLPGA